MPKSDGWFQRGQSGNVSGRPRALLTKPQVEILFQALHMKTRDELQAILDEDSAPVLKVMVAKTMLEAARTGDYGRIEFLLNRAVGKVRDEAIVEQVRGNNREILRGVPTVQLLRLVDEERERVKLAAMNPRNTCDDIQPGNEVSIRVD